jgi:hypothetical protein
VVIAVDILSSFRRHAHQAIPRQSRRREGGDMRFWNKLFRRTRTARRRWAGSASQEDADRFAAAEALAKQGKQEQALSAFESLRHDPAGRRKVVSAEFLGLVELRIAMLLIALQRYDEASVCLDAPILKTCIQTDQFAPVDLFDCYMTYAALEKARNDEVALIMPCMQALRVSWQMLRDQLRATQVWQLWLDALGDMREWEQLLARCDQAEQFVRVFSAPADANLRSLLQRRRAFAYRGLGNTAAAHAQASTLLSIARSRRDDPAIQEWEAFLASL